MQLQGRDGVYVSNCASFNASVIQVVNVSLQSNATLAVTALDLTVIYTLQLSVQNNTSGTLAANNNNNNRTNCSVPFLSLRVEGALAHTDMQALRVHITPHDSIALNYSRSMCACSSVAWLVGTSVDVSSCGAANCALLELLGLRNGRVALGYKYGFV
jgi:hypothetical protein